MVKFVLLQGVCGGVLYVNPEAVVAVCRGNFGDEPATKIKLFGGESFFVIDPIEMVVGNLSQS